MQAVKIAGYIHKCLSPGDQPVVEDGTDWGELRCCRDDSAAWLNNTHPDLLSGFKETATSKIQQCLSCPHSIVITVVPNFLFKR